MKMDAMQKQRIRKAARIHFLLSVLSGLLFSIMAPALATSKSHSEPDAVFLVIFLMAMLSFFLLQPQFLIIQIFFAILALRIYPMDFFLSVVIAPFWSYAFAWIFIRTKDWLNHFPVLGKKVF
jgi:hypothetical protein